MNIVIHLGDDQILEILFVCLGLQIIQNIRIQHTGFCNVLRRALDNGCHTCRHGSIADDKRGSYMIL